MKQRFPKISVYIRWGGLSVLAGVLAGLAATVFLVSLAWATAVRLSHPGLIWFLPLAGFGLGWVYLRYGRDVAGGHNLILDEIHDPKKTLPLRMSPLILLGTLVTHLFGGSAGREGTAVQMGASLADQLNSFFRIGSEERKILLVAGAGAGFGAAIGTPLAGAVFGMEVVHIGRLRPFAWFQCLLASVTGYGVTILLRAPHSVYPGVGFVSYEWKAFVIVALFGAVCGIAAFSFSSVTHAVERGFGSFVRYPPLKPMIGGFLLVLLYQWEGSYLYTGLGIPVIQEAFSQVSPGRVPLLKALFTTLTVGSGFKGGEFIPLVFIGTTLGSCLSTVFGVATPLLAALGFAAVFAGASNTPIACAIMAAEIFGWEIGGYALLACLVSYYCSGHRGIYKSQRVTRLKYEGLRGFWKKR